MGNKNTTSQNIVITGAGGRMGKTLLELLPEYEEFQLTGALEQTESPVVGQSIDELFDGYSEDTPSISDDPKSVIDSNTIVIDFTHPDASRTFLNIAQDRGTKLVIGTTGLTDEDHELIREVSKDTAILQAPNMSVGVNLLRNLVNQTTETLGTDFDVEIVEMHHRHKEDAPSGTANMLAEEVANTRNQNLENVKTTGRDGFVGERDSDEIGVFSLRGGDVVGDHTVTFAGEGERIELTHKASSRDTFARGALRAAKFLTQKESGLYSMDDVLGLGG